MQTVAKENACVSVNRSCDSSLIKLCRLSLMLIKQHKTEEIPHCSRLKPYSHRISIIWGPWVILTLPSHIWILCSAFARDKRRLWFYSNLRTYLLDIWMSKLWEARSMVRLDGFKKKKLIWFRAPCHLHFTRLILYLKLLCLIYL